jgi:RNA polymerase sigma-70 factor (ECF subfamily)
MKKGDAAAFREFVEVHQARLYRTVATMVGNREDARDLTQEIFLKAFDGIGTFRGGSTLGTWLYRITVNLCIDHQRSLRARPAFAEFDETAAAEGTAENASDGAATPLGNVLRGETAVEVAAALDCLSPEHRAILVLREIDGLSYEELASVLGIGMGTVMSRLHYARAQMKKRLDASAVGREVSNVENVRFLDAVPKEA